MTGVSPTGPGCQPTASAAEEASSRSGIPNAACRNCAGEAWVCENHQDTPWETSGHSDNCGAGAPCPVCNREMACAPYMLIWLSASVPPEDNAQVLIGGGTFHDDGDWPGTEYEFAGHAVVSFNRGTWQGEQRAHDEYRWHQPAVWMRLPILPASAMSAFGQDPAEGLEAKPASAAPEGGDAR